MPARIQNITDLFTGLDCAAAFATLVHSVLPQLEQRVKAQKILDAFDEVNRVCGTLNRVCGILLK